jgi:hypothetical protein
MLSHLYIEAPLVDEETADAVWEAWDRGEISTYWVVWMWWAMVEVTAVTSRSPAKLMRGCY